MKYHLAIDIGASSGRHILGYINDGKLIIEEIYRFDNNIVSDNGSLVWDIESLVDEVKKGIKKCREIGKIPETLAIDTWGVDYVLTDENNKELLPVFSYRDSRTDSVDKDVEAIISPQRMYSKTGTQKQKFNTVYQLYCDKISGKLDRAKNFMMIPAYLSYRLCGEIKNEYTNATTTGLVNAKEYTYDAEMLEALGIAPELFGELSRPGSLVGEFTEEMQEYAGYNCRVLFCPSHDTACAVAACPLGENDIYISSGTWSLIGTEITEPILSDEARKCNFTNEGGIERRFRFLKNYMGMWLFQNIRRNLDKKLSYDEMMTLAADSERHHYIDVNAPEFVAPENMIEAIKKHLNMPDIPLGELINSVYHSLAKSYKNAIDEVEKISGITANAVHIVGGGSKDSYLNLLTAKYTGKKVTSGPVEATAIGNIASQILAETPGYTLGDMRKIIINSFDIKEVN